MENKDNKQKTADDSLPATKPRFRWKWSVCNRTKSSTTYPFINNSNHQELVFLDILLKNRPFDAGHGKKKSIWDAIIRDCLDADAERCGILEFNRGDRGISVAAAKRRYQDYLDLEKALDNGGFDSGNASLNGILGACVNDEDDGPLTVDPKTGEVDVAKQILSRLMTLVKAKKLAQKRALGEEARTGEEQVVEELGGAVGSYKKPYKKSRNSGIPESIEVHHNGANDDEAKMIESSTDDGKVSAPKRVAQKEHRVVAGESLHRQPRQGGPDNPSSLDEAVVRINTPGRQQQRELAAAVRPPYSDSGHPHAPTGEEGSDFGFENRKKEAEATRLELQNEKAREELKSIKISVAKALLVARAELRALKVPAEEIEQFLPLDKEL